VAPAPTMRIVTVFAPPFASQANGTQSTEVKYPLLRRPYPGRRPRAGLCPEKVAAPRTGEIVSMNAQAESRGTAATTTLDVRVRRLESQVSALIEAVEVLARGFEDAPIAAGRSEANGERAARRAHELLLLVKSAQQDTRGDS
jgi:hypothetical protein